MKENNQNKEPLNKDFKVPKIRFRDFKIPWSFIKLSDLVSIHARIGWHGLKQEEHLVSGEYCLITGTDFADGEIDFSSIKYISKHRYEQDKNIQINNNDILITKDGSIGKVAIVKNMSKPATLNAGVYRIRVRRKGVEPEYLYQYLSGPFLLDFASKQSSGGTIKHLNQSQIMDFNVPFTIFDEQKKISSLLSKLDMKIKLVKTKMLTLKKYRKGLIQVGIKHICSSKRFIRFTELYTEINKRNIICLNQYTVGKDGLKPIYESSYDLQNHKMFHPNCLLMGIGIEEIAVSANNSGSVSPVYNVYRINHKDYFNYSRFFLKPILWRKKAFITRKSTRREYEIDTKELLRFNLPIPVDSQFDVICKSIISLDILIQKFTNKLEQTKTVKSYLLKNMFI